MIVFVCLVNTRWTCDIPLTRWESALSCWSHRTCSVPPGHLSDETRGEELRGEGGDGKMNWSMFVRSRGAITNQIWSPGLSVRKNWFKIIELTSFLFLNWLKEKWRKSIFLIFMFDSLNVACLWRINFVTRIRIQRSIPHWIILRMLFTTSSLDISAVTSSPSMSDSSPPFLSNFAKS